ncbi:MAG: hypothetical protein LBL65_00640 [Campylobacteraceae bacterium]|jgi:hypothetical protein|nr:hypothetical protein [Campylobacteraceae bacterium]
MKKIHGFFWLISLLLGIISNMFFLMPIVYYIIKIKSYESDKIEFINFIAGYNVFLVHSIAAIIAFIAFLFAILAFFQEKMYYYAGIALMISLAVIAPYLMGYEKIFLFLF